jgi:4-amino-4-deoxy-L-arabinose transferase-like glycosyltransferase
VAAILPNSDASVVSGRARAWDVILALVPLAVFLVLWAFVRADPARGVTASNGPYTDEAWDVINARNFVLLGHFSTDDWNLHLVNLPFTLVQTAVFTIAGVGMAQARLVSIAATAVTTLALGFGLRRHLGAPASLVAAVAFGGCTLVLFYGRLAFLEPMVAMWLTLGGLLALRAWDDRSGRWGLLSGLFLALGVGTKPSAAFAVAGILAGLTVAGRSSPRVRRWIGGAAAAIAGAGATWVVLVGLPNLTAIKTDLRIWASEPILSSPGSMLHAFTSYPTRSDSFLVLAAPILVSGFVGLALAIRARASMPPSLQGMVGAAAGWLLLGFGLLSVAPYRPNRYEVPMLPALAILTGVGLWAIGQLAPDWSAARARVLAAIVAAVLVVPGLANYAQWMQVATYDLPSIQTAVVAAIPAGSAVQGDVAPAFALQAPVTTIVSRPPTKVNSGDLYVTRGVRWYVGAAGSKPAWASLHPSAWDARQTVLCAPWGSQNVCVWRLP